MAQYFLTREAQHSIASIKEFSSLKFGERRTNQYLAALRLRMRYLAEHPKHGKARTDLFSDWLCYSYFEGSHTIYYEIQSNHIMIIDVLHQSMDSELHLISP